MVFLIILSFIFIAATALVTVKLITTQKQLTEKTAEATAATSRAEMHETAAAEARTEIETLRERLVRFNADNARLQERATALENEIKRNATTLSEERERLFRDNEQRFRLLATEILESNSRKFKEQNEIRLGEILTPFKEDIDRFRKTVTDTYSQETREIISLQQSLKEMMELNRTIGKEAKDLTQALRGNSKIQGDWGEMILEMILEKSGLKKGIHYSTQLTTDNDGKTLRSDEGRVLRPDVVVRYPDGRAIVIDSKVSLSAYISLVNATDNADIEHYGRQHLASVRSHIRELSEKSYQEYVGEKKTDFVMMFVPNEAAYISAMNLDPNLWQEAYEKRVIIISPTNLISAIKLIEQLWRQDDIKRNAIDIANESGRLYDKFVGFIEDLEKIRKNLEAACESRDNAMRKLKDGSGNIIGKIEKLRKMGAKASKQLPSSLLPDFDE